MQTATRLLFAAYVGQIAQLNSLDPAFGAASGELKRFNVSPVVEQRLQAKLALSSDFMSRINVIPVVAQQGDRVGVGVGRTIAGRTNTAAGTRRDATDPAASDEIDQYFCKQTNYDYSLPYSRLDAWAHRPEFQTLVRDAIVVQKASDIITIGFRGTSAAVQTDRVANPMLTDVNIGWLQKMRTYAPARCTAHGDLDANFVYVDDAGYAANKADFPNLDALVFDAKHNLLHEVFRDATDLVVIVGSDLVHEKYFPIITEAGNSALSQLARDVILSARSIGGLPPVQVPFFPPNALMITSLSNLSYYWQIGSGRRQVTDEPQYDRIMNYESMNEAFMVEEYGKACLIENIKIGAKA